MATFTCQYRDSSGALKTLVVEAASRTDVFAVLKGRGIRPLRVAQGGKAVAQKAHSKPFRWWISLAACALVCVVIAVAAFLLLGGKEGADARPRKPDVPASQPKTKPAERPKPSAVAQKPSPEPAPAAAAGRAEAVASNDVMAVAETPNTNKVFRAPSLSKRTVTRMDGTTAELTSRRIFGRDKPLDLQLMAVTKPGGMASGLRALRVRYSDDEIIAMLNEPVIYDKNDPDDVKDIKMRVQRQKNIVLDFLKQGGTVTDAIDQMCQSAGKERIEMRNDQIELNKLVGEGDSEAVRNFLNERNASRRELGLPELSLPSQYQLPPEEKSK